MSWITENDLDAAQANVRLAQALAAAWWDPTKVVVDDQTVESATELVIPDGTKCEEDISVSAMKDGLFARTKRLKLLVVGDVDLPACYFSYLNAEKVEIPMSSFRNYMFQNSNVRRVVVKAGPAGKLPAEPAKQADFA